MRIFSSFTNYLQVDNERMLYFLFVMVPKHTQDFRRRGGGIRKTNSAVTTIKEC
jgi:hypothetical protein